VPDLQTFLGGLLIVVSGIYTFKKTK